MRLQEQAKPIDTTPTRTSPDLSRLLEVEEGRRHLLEALEHNSAWKLRVIRGLREQGVTLESIGGVLGISKQAVNLLLKRAPEGS